MKSIGGLGRCLASGKGVVMLKLKSCPRCNGDVRLDRDQYGWYEACMQCGYLRDLESVAVPRKENPEKKEAGRWHRQG